MKANHRAVTRTPTPGVFRDFWIDSEGTVRIEFDGIPGTREFMGWNEDLQERFPTSRGPSRQQNRVNVPTKAIRARDAIKTDPISKVSRAMVRANGNVSFQRDSRGFWTMVETPKPVKIRRKVSEIRRRKTRAPEYTREKPVPFVNRWDFEGKLRSNPFHFLMVERYRRVEIFIGAEVSNVDLAAWEKAANL